MSFSIVIFVPILIAQAPSRVLQARIYSFPVGILKNTPGESAVACLSHL